MKTTITLDSEPPSAKSKGEEIIKMSTVAGVAIVLFMLVDKLWYL